MANDGNPVLVGFRTLPALCTLFPEDRPPARLWREHAAAGLAPELRRQRRPAGARLRRSRSVLSLSLSLSLYVYIYNVFKLSYTPIVMIAIIIIIIIIIMSIVFTSPSARLRPGRRVLRRAQLRRALRRLRPGPVMIMIMIIIAIIMIMIMMMLMMIILLIITIIGRVFRGSTLVRFPRLVALSSKLRVVNKSTYIECIRGKAP